MTTTNLLSIPIRDLAALTADFAYPATLNLTDYFRSELMIPADARITDRASLRDALDRDIRDMLHNCNLDMLFPSYDIDMLDELNPDANRDTHDLLADRCDDAFIDHLTSIILAR